MRNFFDLSFWQLIVANVASAVIVGALALCFAAALGYVNGSALLFYAAVGATAVSAPIALYCAKSGRSRLGLVTGAVAIVGGVIAVVMHSSQVPPLIKGQDPSRDDLLWQPFVVIFGFAAMAVVSYLKRKDEDED